jgi:xanthine/uracil permease
MSTKTSMHKPATSRQSLMAVLLRSPRVIAMPSTRLIVTGLIVIGALLTAISGIIHLFLYGKYDYSVIPTIGPLFIAQGVVAILLALLVLGTRWLAAVVAAAGFLIATAVGLVLTIYVGLFNFTEVWSAPWAVTSFVLELAGAAFLLIAAWPLLRPGPSTR